MDEIEYKLQSANPVLISHAISKLFDSVKKKTCNQADNNISQIPEFKSLSAKRDSANVTVSISACQALIALVENGLWNIGDALSTFVSSLSSIKNYTVAATAIGNLLTMHLKTNKEHDAIYPFTLHAPQHPFIMILNLDKYSWHCVLNEMARIMNHQDSRIRKNSIEMLRPVFLYILCNPFSNPLDCCAQRTWQLLIKSEHGVCLQTEVSLWLYTAETYSCINTNYRILEVAEKASREKNKDLCTAIAAVLASLSLQLLKHGSDPTSNFDMLLAIIDQCDIRIGDLMLALMAEVIILCPATYLHSALRICATITKRMSCSDLCSNTVTAAILKWMAYPSLLCSDALDMATNLLREMFVQRRPAAYDSTTVTSKIFEAFTNFDPCLQFYSEITRCLNSSSPNDILLWLKHVSQAPIDLKDKCKLLLSGLFIETNDPTVTELSCNVLVDVCREVKSFESHLLSLVLHKLTKSKNSKELKYLLLVVPELATTKENVPIITHTLDTLLHGDNQLRCFAIELYLKTLKEQPMCYRFVSAAIIRLMKTDHSWYSDATCARAMRFICENHPEHGETLVPLLSEILNRSTDTNGGTASALALKSISALCKASVIDISSTWRVLAPKMVKEKRVVVLESLCELFGDVASYPSTLAVEAYDQLVSDIVSNLWTYATSNNPRVIESALKALASFGVERIPLETLPASFRSHLVVPDVSTEKPTTLLQYVPASCWTEMLKSIHKLALSSAGNMLVSFVNDEVESLRSGIYIWPYGEPQNFKYLPEKSVIRGVGEYLRRSDKSDPNNHRIITECLRIFAHRYTKPLPNVNWSFLEDTISLSPEAKKYTLAIACRHAKVSLSAKSFMEKYLSTYGSDTGSEPDFNLRNNEYTVLYQNLDDLCQAVQPSNMKPFLMTTLEYIFEKMTFDNERFKSLFDTVMSSYAQTLKNQQENDGNLTLLSDLLEKYFDKIDVTCKRFESYIAATLELSEKHVEMMTSPGAWPEITLGKLKNAIAIRAELAVKKCSEASLALFNELIDEVMSVPSIQMFFLETVQKVHVEMQSVTTVIKWITEFMIKIQVLLLDSMENHNSKIEFYCSVLFVSIISLSGIDRILMKQNLSVTSGNVRIETFTRALTILSDREEWKCAMPQIMEWLNHMRTSSVSNVYRLAFHRSLICLRHNPYYKDVWTKYLSIKTEI